MKKPKLHSYRISQDRIDTMMRNGSISNIWRSLKPSPSPAPFSKGDWLRFNENQWGRVTSIIEIEPNMWRIKIVPKKPEVYKGQWV